VDTGAEPSSCQTEQSAAAADIHKTLSFEILNSKHIHQRPFRFCDPFLIDDLQKLEPILPKGEAFPLKNSLSCGIK
jgi:hypothetical protein